VAEGGNECKVESVGGRGAEGKVGDKEGVIVKDGEGGEEGVGDVKGGGDEKDLEGGGSGGDGSDGVFAV